MLDFLTLPERSAKPRDRGLTHVLDKGLGPAQVDDLMASAAPFIDIVKLGWGTSYITADLARKVEAYQRHDVTVCFGGTLLEVVVRQNRVDDYVAWLRELGITHVEVSDGTVSMAVDDKLALLRRLAREFTVLSEVGSKDTDKVIAPYRWVDAIKRELDAGAWKVIAEGRESGTVGVYHSSGDIKEGLIEEIVSAVSADRLLFEAPVKEQQVWFVKKFGSNVNLGNIPPDEVVSCETIRLGIRSDTLLDFH